MSFEKLGLSEKTIKAIDELGIQDPTTVQTDVIPSILQGKDIFTIAPAGCGKTVSYILPLIDVISNKNGQNILVVTPSSEQSATVSDRLAIFNKYHEINEATVIGDGQEEVDSEANVIIGSPDLLLELAAEEKIDLSKINILVVDDINLIKSNKQLENLEKVLELLPADKQNIIYTNRRSRETSDILDKILKAPEEIKVDKKNELEARVNERAQQRFEQRRNNRHQRDKRPENPYKVSPVQKDEYAFELIKKYNSFNGKTPEFLTNKGIIVNVD